MIYIEKVVLSSLYIIYVTANIYLHVLLYKILKKKVKWKYLGVFEISFL